MTDLGPPIMGDRVGVAVGGGVDVCDGVGAGVGDGVAVGVAVGGIGVEVEGMPA